MSMNISITVLDGKEAGVVEDIGRFVIGHGEVLWTTLNHDASNSRVHKAEQRILRLMKLRKKKDLDIIDVWNSSYNRFRIIYTYD